MKMAKLSKLAIAVILLLAPALAFANGDAERETSYSRLLQTEFEQVLQSVQEGSMTREEAMIQLRQFQEFHNRVNREEYQLMENCIKGVEKGTMTQAEAGTRLAQMLRVRDQSALKEQEQLQTRDRIQAQDQDCGCGEEPVGDEVKNRNGEQSGGKNGGK